MGVGGRRPNTIEPTLKGHHPQPDPSAAGGTIVELPEPVDELSEEGLRIWRLITPELVKGRVLRMDDIPLLVEACEAWALTRKFRQQLWEAVNGLDRLMEMEAPHDPDQREEHYALVELASGQVKRARSAWTSAYKAAMSAAGDLGLGPTARVRLGLAQVQGQSLLESLQSGTQGVPGQKDGA